jgi:hypothetical protein
VTKDSNGKLKKDIARLHKLDAAHRYVFHRTASSAASEDLDGGVTVVSLAAHLRSTSQ